MNARRDLAFLAILGIKLFQNIKYCLILIFYPLICFYVNYGFKKVEVKFVDGPPTAANEIRILNKKKFFLAVMKNKLGGILTSIQHGFIEVESTFKLMHHFISAGGSSEAYDEITWLADNFNLQRGSRAWHVANHYNLGNDLYECMLDENVQYTCGYWKNAKNLDEAQRDKLDLIAKKIQLKPGMRVLDLGCGFGGLAKYFAEKYGVSVVGVTISKEGVEFGRKICEGLDVEFIHADVFDTNFEKEFDRVVSIGLMEHVGKFNYRSFFHLCSKALKDDGIFIAHAIGVNSNNSRTTWYTDEHIFPNGMFVSLREFVTESENIFLVEDVQNMGYDYFYTLQSWEENFTKNWPTLRGKYGDEFYKFWIVYLQLAQALFATRYAQLYQVVYTKKGIRGGYYAAR